METALWILGGAIVTASIVAVIVIYFPSDRP